MAQLSLNRMRLPSGTEWIAGGAALLATLVYLFVLHGLDRRAESYFMALRENDPATYLMQLREAKGFDAFLPEYAALEGLGDFTPRTPTFLIGRWTLREDMLRLTPGQAPSACSDPATFEFGLFLMVEAGGPALAVQYRIDGDTVEMRSSAQAVYPIRLVSFGAQLDHIEFTPPGRDTPAFAYLCRR
ncbi:hypothetical protein [Defluviimonas sp. SAOS-178_SWC]|uniref:hypothetical protein n=1 Tax=Defluviimonas sp. SAOS-178_SWC TaxID=3121287 RepID=UPI00322197FB